MPRRKSKEAAVPPPPPPRDCQAAEAELLDEQFENLLRIANSLIPKFKVPDDVEIAERTISKCKKLHAKANNDIKRWVLDFFTFFLKALYWTSNNQLDIYEKWYPNNKENAKTWLTKNKSYMAMKKLDSGAVIVYIAISNEPCSGWQEEGLKSLMESCSSN